MNPHWTDQDAEACACELRGTCDQSLEQVAEYIFEGRLSGEEVRWLVDHPPFYEQVYGLVDVCAQCGWWEDTSELEDDENGELLCQDCLNE